MPPGPDNPLGEYALTLSLPSYLIHGTNKPFAVGRRVSSGCIRMYTKDVEQLYDAVRVGTKVVIVDEPTGGLDPLQQREDTLRRARKII